MAEAHGDVDILRRIEDTTLNDQNLARDAKILDDYKLEDSEIRKFLKDRCIFITGGTGFLGKVLVEKLLRSCPEIRAIFLLIRQKKAKDLKERVDDFFRESIFSVLEKERPKYRRQVVPIEGDTELFNLGLSEENREMITQQASIFFHIAATVRFDEPLKKAVNVNVRGTCETLKLAASCAKLESFVQFSTAFSHCPRDNIDEVFYDPPMDPFDLINLVENTSEAKLNEMTPHLDGNNSLIKYLMLLLMMGFRLLGNFPNTYAYSKAVAEELVKNKGVGLPICIFRPSIVIGTYREPVRGWVDNLYGPIGILVGAGVGLIHTLWCDPEKVADLVPVDLVANCAIVCAWKTAMEGVKSHDPTIYNYVSSPQKPITWALFCKMNKDFGIKVPTMHAIWYYNFMLIKNWYLYMLATIFLHFLPAILVDGFCKLTGREAKMVQTYKKVINLNNTISYFATREWKFSNRNVRKLWIKLNPADQQIFTFDMSQLEWERHAETCCMGVRVYLLKDPASTLPEARKKWERLRKLDLALKAFFILLFLIMFGQLFYKISTLFV